MNPDSTKLTFWGVLLWSTKIKLVLPRVLHVFRHYSLTLPPSVLPCKSSSVCNFLWLLCNVRYNKFLVYFALHCWTDFSQVLRRQSLSSLKLKEKLARDSVKKNHKVSHKKKKKNTVCIKNSKQNSSGDYYLFPDTSESRIMERVALNSINKELKDWNIFNTSQHDVMENRSCHTNLDSFFDEMTSLVDKEPMQT